MPKLHIVAASGADSACQNGQIYQCDIIEQFENLETISQIITQSSAECFLLTEMITEPAHIPDCQLLDTIQANGSSAWLAKSPHSFAEFAVRVLGGKMASLWFALWKTGAVLAPAQALRSALEQSHSLREAITRLNWTEPAEEEFLEIDWSDSSVDLPELAPETERPELKQLESLIQNLEELLPKSFDQSSPDFTAVRAGLYQWHDALEVSHGYSQDAEHRGKNQAADYWHAIMHRREPDYSNSKYWFRHVGNSPLFAKLFDYSRHISSNIMPGHSWDPFYFVDYCSRCRQGSQEKQLAQRIQAVEMVLLMQQTMRDAQR